MSLAMVSQPPSRSNCGQEHPNEDINTEHLYNEFLVGDVLVGEEQHFIFATMDHLTFLQQACRWYMDSSFQVMNKPFAKLYLIHDFLKLREVMKHVPLMFFLMSK